ncbi:S8 family serine peptidase [Limnobacter humi]|uniref:S8 family serine peptidase n=1 Tax=Limnobacter humi TaxID=1778671 RepID=A0ABT1WHP9_9BURK|nr:S8 family serine peptidase [Limnobacter humi]MCQ8895959.1 S8 family serine peptidase [Limnobacter humi]
MAGALLFAGSAIAVAGEHRLVIQFKQGANQAQAMSLQDQQGQLQSRLDVLAKAHKRTMRMVRPFANNGVVARVSDDDLPSLLNRIQSDPDVVAVAEDRRVHLTAQSPLVGLLNGLDFSRRSRSWYHQDLSAQPASINSAALWTRFHGSSPSIIAVLDTGVLPDHPMLQGHLLPGYDMIADPLIGADNQGTGANSRDNDPTDPGDGVSLTDLAADPACSGLSNSSWHGTFVAGLLAGNPIASEGVFSVNWSASIVPVRVLGKCGGFSSDLADGIRWAAGLPVAGAPTNPFPAKVINLSLGSQGACVSSIEGAAVTAARNAGALVVVAAGNDGSAVDSPANCPGAFAVAALDQEGLKANYSNFGSVVQMAAPGGDAAYPIWSASNTGVYGPLTNTYNSKIGTSFAAPMVAGAAAMYWSLNPSASVATVESALKATARPFITAAGVATCSAANNGSACNCNGTACGAGMLDVSALINTVAAGGLTNLFSNTGSVIPPGGTRTFLSSGSTNATGQEVNSVAYTIANVVRASGSTASPTLSSSGLSTDITAPVGVLGFDLTASAPGGRSSTLSVTVADSGATSPTLLASLLSPLLNGAAGLDSPAVSGTGSGTGGSVGESGGSGGTSGGGGGGALSLGGLCAMGLLMRRLRQSGLGKTP